MYTHIPPAQVLETLFSKIFYQQITNPCISGFCKTKKVEKEEFKYELEINS